MAPTSYGGTEGVLDRLARGLVEFGHEVLLFTTGDSTCPVDRDWVLPRAEPARLGNALVEIHHVVHAYDAVQHMDIVHDHTAVGPLYAWRFASLPVVTTNHGPFDDEFAALYRAADHRVAIVAISEHQASTAVGVQIDAVIHHGVDPEAFPFGNGDGGYCCSSAAWHPKKAPAKPHWSLAKPASRC